MKQDNKSLLSIAAIVMVVAFFMPVLSAGFFGGNESVSMWNAMTGDKRVGGSFWWLLLLLAPIYLLLHYNQDKVKLAPSAYIIPKVIAVAIPAVLLIIVTSYTELTSSVFIKLGTGYWVYLIAAAVAVLIAVPQATTKEKFEKQRSWALCVGAVLLLIVIRGVAVIYCEGSDAALWSVSEFDRPYYNLDIFVALKWVMVVLTVYLAVSAFRKHPALAGLRMLLLPPKVTTILIAVAAALTQVAVIGLTSSHKHTFDSGPATILMLILAAMLIVLAYRKQIVSAAETVAPEAAAAAAPLTGEGTAAAPTVDEQMQAMKVKGEQALASAKESLAKAQKELAPRLAKAKEELMPKVIKAKEELMPKVVQAVEWCKANVKKIGIGAAAIAVVALLIWLLPKLFAGGTKPLEFETYVVEAQNTSARITLSIPKGDSEQSEKAAAGIRYIMDHSAIAKEVGVSNESTLKAAADDYIKRIDKVLSSGDYGMVIAELDIQPDYQNEASLTFQVADGIYGNGSPNYYDQVVRLSDGHVMEQQEMVNIATQDLVKLIEQYRGEDEDYMVADVYTLKDEGYWFSPVSEDTCRVVWPVSRAMQGIVLFPVSAVEQYMTEESKALFTAKAVTTHVRQTEESSESSGEAPEGDGDFDADVDMEDMGPTGLLGSLPTGTTEYAGEMAGFPIEFTITKDPDGAGLKAHYKNVKYTTTMELNGESLPADDGNITFFGDDGQGHNWSFDLEGDADNIVGKASSSAGGSYDVTLHRK